MERKSRIVKDVCKNGRWLRTVSVNGIRFTTRAGAYYMEMMRRCNTSLQIGKYDTYKGCSSEFKDFQDFAGWATKQVYYGLGQLDKDLLVKGNKLYSKRTCLFIPTGLNNLLTKCNKARGDLPIGVHLDEKRGYKVACADGSGSKTYLGYYQDAETAFSVYKTYKESIIKQQANKWRDQIDPRAYDALMNYEVEITD